jgi:hypothetical protein
MSPINCFATEHQDDTLRVNENYVLAMDKRKGLSARATRARSIILNSGSWGGMATRKPCSVPVFPVCSLPSLANAGGWRGSGDSSLARADREEQRARAA